MHTIAIEGLDGVGKTATAEAVAQNVGGRVLSTITLAEEWRLGRERVNREKDVEARFTYFLHLNMVQMLVSRALAEPGQAIVMDSSIYRTLATHRVLGSKKAAEYEIPPLLIPDSSFLLELEEPERVQRLTERDGSIKFSSHWDVTLFGLRDDLMQELHSFNMRSLSAADPITEVVGQIQQVALGADPVIID